MAGEGAAAPAATTRTTPERRRAGTRAAPPLARGPLALVVVLLLAVFVVYASRYGPHRDELYFAEAGRHLAWGYPDQPPLTPAIARLATLVAPGSVTALHVPAALALAGVVVLAVLSARELGGTVAAQVLTAVATGTGVVTVVLGHMLSTASVDALFWAGIVYAALVTLRRDRPRRWLVVGAVAGVGLENKNTVAFLLGALLVGVAVVQPTRHHLRSPWLWAGGALALVLWLPNLLWQASHGWPQLTLAGDINAEYGTVGERLAFVGLLVVLFSPLVAAIWVYGLARLWRVPDLATARPLAWAFVLLVVVFLAAGGKAYYLTGLLPALIAAGCCGLAARRSRRSLVITGAVVGATSMAFWPTGLPILSPHAFGASFYAGINEDAAEMIGWPAFVRTVDDAARASGAVAVVAQNYGEAGALDWYGSPAPVFSGHNGYADWGHPVGSAGPFVLVGYDTAPAWAEGCRTVAHVDNGEDVDNEEQGGPVMVCAAPTGPWASVWPQVRHLDA
ncbi:glycosyltransferase family 39 protein [Luteimicrobium sp. DT211]|uniref:glycosyltransferase family 39 protein n=1 Tax=Luteimicrobium sp. DT211 TaxID=3393412 RepID=UPI003CF3BD72